MNTKLPGQSVLALDLDGTIVTHDYRISGRTIDAVRRFRESRGDVLIATGRAARSALPWASHLGGVSGMICHNGAAAYSPRQGSLVGVSPESSPTEKGTGVIALPYALVASTFLSRDIAALLVSFARETDIHFHVFQNDEWLFEREFEGTAVYRRRAGFDGVQTKLEGEILGGLFKAMFVDRPGVRIDGVSAELRGLLGGDAEVMFTSPGFLEVMAPGVSKARGLELWLATRGKSMQDVLAIGDADNDESMLLAAGIGVAMGNAHPSLKEKVGRVAPPIEEDGAAATVEAFLDGALF